MSKLPAGLSGNPNAAPKNLVEDAYMFVAFSIMSSAFDFTCNTAEEVPDLVEETITSEGDDIVLVYKLHKIARKAEIKIYDVE